MATISKSSELELALALERVNARYGDNVEFKGTGSNFHRGIIRPRGGSVLAFSLNVKSSRGPGHRMTAVPPYEGAKAHRLRAACWHVWRDYLTELFAINPNCIVRTSLATYRGQKGFEDTFPSTYWRNGGSQALPQPYGSLCECKEDTHPRAGTGRYLAATGD